jgi:polyisoprenoid-binding protein YceI
MKTLISTLLAAIWLTLSLPATAAPAWTVDATKSQLTFKVNVNGQIVDGRFPGFGSVIRFDPADLASSSVKITVDTTGIKTNDVTRDAMLLKPAWFNVLGFPKATFQSTRFIADGPGRFFCEGKLTIKGITQDMKLPFTLDMRGNKAVVRGTGTIRRLDFKIGEGPDFATGSPVALEVKVNFDVTATQNK